MGSPAVVKTIPIPLNGTEIKQGIAVRMTQDLPADVAESLRGQIVSGLGKTCSLMPSSAYSKFSARWTLAWWRVGAEIHAHWWVDYSLDDFGRVTKGGIGDRRRAPGKDNVATSGVIDEVPPDRFRRETDQPIPKPVELKHPEPEKSNMSRAQKGKGKGRMV